MIILDSSFLIAYYNERDANHASAEPLMTRFLAGEWGKGLLLEYVFVEVVTVLMARRGVATASEVGQLLLSAQELQFVPCSPAFLITWTRFSQQNNSRFSFADVAILVESANHAGGVPLLTFDEEFKKVHGLQVNPP